MRRPILPTLACLTLLLAGGSVVASTVPGATPVLPDDATSWIAGETAREPVPDLQSSGVPYGAVVTSGASGGRLTGSPEGLSPAGASVSTATHVVVRKTAVLEEKVREARRALDQ